MLVSLMSRVLSALRREEGATMAEYAVVLAVVITIVVASLTALAGGIGGALDGVTALLTGDDSGTG